MEGKKRQVVEPDLYDISAYRRHLRRYLPLLKLAFEGKEALPFFPWLLEDIFRAVYKEHVELRDSEDLLPPHRPQRQVIDQLRRQRWLDQFRPTTMLREEEAIVATELIGRALLELAQGKEPSKEGREELGGLDREQLGELLRQMVEEIAREQEPEPSEAEAEAAEKEEERREIEEEFKSRIEAIAKPMEEGREDAEKEKAAPEEEEEQEQEPEPSEAEAEAAEKEEERREIEEEFKSRIEAIAKPMEEGREDAEAAPDEAEKILRGMDASLGEGHYYTTDTREEFKEALTWVKELRRFARALGRLLRTSFKKRLERLPIGAEELYEVETGRDLRRLLVVEWAKRIHPALRRDFLKRFATGDLLQYRLRSRVPLGKGSKIFAIDLSRSLHDEDHVRQGLEKLIATALLLYSKRGEAFCAIYFQDDPSPPVVELSNPPTIAQWIDLATRFGVGGTSFVRALEKAVALIEGDSHFRKADIVLITDGQPFWTEADARKFTEWFLSKKKELGFTLITIILDWRASIYWGFDETQVGFSDQVVKVTELLTKEELEGITEIFTGKPIESHTLA